MIKHVILSFERPDDSVTPAPNYSNITSRSFFCMNDNL